MSLHSNTINRVSLFNYSLPLINPIQLSETRLSTRQVLLIQWVTPEREFWTEISPLPGYSRETISDCVSQLKGLFSTSRTFSFSVLQACMRKYASLKPSITYPLFNCLYGTDPLPALPNIRICPLVLPNESLPGSSVVKLKVGHESIEKDIARVKCLLDSNAFSGKLRLDANQQWTLSNIETFSRSVDAKYIEWLEDPLVKSEHYRDWQNYTDLPFALDERLYQEAELAEEVTAAKALILKPALLGQVRLQRCLTLAKQKNIQVVISSSFEGPLGLASLYALASEVAPDGHHGLDTLRFFPEKFRKNLVKAHMSLVEQWQW